MVPPNQPSFTSVTVCPASCTENGLPADGINVFAGELHSHLLGECAWQVIIGYVMSTEFFFLSKDAR